MKAIFSAMVWTSFILGVFTLTNELLFDLKFKNMLPTRSHGFPPGAQIHKIILNSHEFTRSQFIAIGKRIERIPVELFKHLCVLGSSLFFINLHMKKIAMRTAIQTAKLLPQLDRGLRIQELVYVSTITTALLASVFGSGFPTGGLVQHELVPVVLLVYLVLLVVIIPVIYLLASKLLRFYSSKLITACYLAYFIKAISEFINLDDVNKETMRPVDTSGFSRELREYLGERNLQNRVYTEIKKKPGTLNAALVGWGSLERIEIYGEHSTLTDREFEAVLLHEIGHSQDHSLLKKIAALFTLKLVEMSIVLFLYNSIAKKYTDDIISRTGAFLILFVIYFLFINRWVLVLHKLTSHGAEKAADRIAKAHGYGQELAKVLYDITVHGNSNIVGMWLFNALKSYHPTIYDRVEFLLS